MIWVASSKNWLRSFSEPREDWTLASCKSLQEYYLVWYLSQPCLAYRSRGFTLYTEYLIITSREEYEACAFDILYLCVLLDNYI